MREYGLIGQKLSHSMSQRYFTEKFVSEGLTDCKFTMLEFPAIEDLHRVLEEHPDLKGFNVTIPYKQQIIPFLSKISDEARAIGAVNCVRRTAGGLSGYNTDVIGIRRSLDVLLEGETPEALLLGTGGAAKAVGYALAERGIKYLLVSRDASRGDITYGQITDEVLASHKLVVNATPVGTHPDDDAAPVLPYSALTPEHRLFDLVYNPPVTKFLDYGRRAGARILNGETLFRTQAVAGWNIWNE